MSAVNRFLVGLLLAITATAYKDGYKDEEIYESDLFYHGGTQDGSVTKDGQIEGNAKPQGVTTGYHNGFRGLAQFMGIVTNVFFVIVIGGAAYLYMNKSAEVKQFAGMKDD